MSWIDRLRSAVCCLAAPPPPAAPPSVDPDPPEEPGDPPPLHDCLLLPLAGETPGLSPWESRIYTAVVDVLRAEGLSLDLDRQEVITRRDAEGVVRRALVIRWHMPFEIPGLDAPPPDPGILPRYDHAVSYSRE